MKKVHDLEGDFPNSEERPNLLTKIGVAGGSVIIMFSENINWISLDPEGAREFAAGLIESADVAGKKLN